MTKLVLALTLALVPTAAFAAPAVSERRVTSDGMTFVYTVAQRGDTQIIDGHEERTGRRFHYVVNGTHVSGNNEDQQISFDMPAAGAPEQLATRR